MLDLRLPLARFATPGELYFGKGCGIALRAITATRIAWVAGHHSEGQAAAEDLRKQLPAVEIVALVPQSGEPTLESVEALASDLRRFAPDWIVAVGGGAIVDAAKLARALVEHPEAKLDDWQRPFSMPPLGARVRLAAAPTTAGTGAEVSVSALVALPGGHKRPFVSQHLLPDLVLLEPALTASAPAALTAATALDGAAHAIEGAASKIAHPWKLALASEALRLVEASLPRALAAPDDLAARGALQQAGAMSGLVQSHVSVGLAHGIAHHLAGFGASHGVLVAAVLPAVLRRAANGKGAAAWSELASRSGLGAGALDLAAWLERHRAAAGLPSTLAAAGVPRAVTREAERRAAMLADVCTRTHPDAVAPAELDLLLDELGG